MYFYFDGAFTVMRKELSLDEPVDGQILSRALKKTSMVHPYLTWTVKEKDGDFYFEDTERPATLICGTDNADLGSSKTDMHLAAVLYQDNRICLDLYHGLLDGVAAKRVLETLLLFYFSEKDNVEYDTPEVMTGMVPDASGLYAEPFENRIEDDTDLPDETAEPGEIFSFSEYEEASSDNHYRRIGIPSNDFMKFVKEKGATPASALSVLICHAIQEMYPDNKKPIKINIPINLRSALNCEQTFRNTTGDVPLYFDPAVMSSMRMEEQFSILRRALKDSLRPENQRRIAASQMDFLKMTSQYKDYASKYGFYSSIPVPPSDSVFISYIGRFNGGSYVEHIRDASLISGARDGMVFNIYDCGGKFHVSMIKKGSIEAFSKAFINVLKAIGVSAEASSETVFKLHYIPLRENLGLDFKK